MLSPARIVVSIGDEVRAETNYAVFRTRPAGVSEVFSVGRYLDVLHYQNGLLKFKSRLCVYDSEMVLNSLIYPI